jgi:hypothetical protein
MGYVEGCAHLAVALASPRARAHHARKARRCAAWLDAEGHAYTRGLSLLLDGGASLALEEDARARAAFVAAADILEACGMNAHAAVARLRWEALVGGPEGRRVAAPARRWLEEQGIGDVAGLAAVLCPSDLRRRG